MGDHSSAVRRARTFLFVPGDRPDRFPKAMASGADLVVLDLEDAVAPDLKTEARDAVRLFLRTGAMAAVRVNALDTPWHEPDLQMLTELGDQIVMLPKAERVRPVAAVAGRLSRGSAVVALIETARGVLNAADLAEIPGVERLALGTLDLAAELGVEPNDPAAMDPARYQLVLASASAGLMGPIDGVTVEVNDPIRLKDDISHATRLGLTAKLCIHPRQVRAADVAMQPSAEQIAWVAAVLAASDEAAGGPVLLDGRMVDKPVVDRARRLAATFHRDQQLD